MSEARIVELVGSDGEACRCQLHKLFPFNGKEYALLQNEENGDVVLMGHVTRGEQSVFQVIESGEEFEQVTRFVRALYEAD